MEERIIETDVLVIGSGAAGLRAAIEARRFGVDVHLVDKSLIGYNNNSRFSGGGLRIASTQKHEHEYTSHHKTPEEHFRDNLRVGEFLNDQTVAETFAFDGPARVMELRDFGVEHVPFMYLYYSFPHGTGLVKPLVSTVRKLGVHTHRRAAMFDLLTHGGEVVGALGVELDTGRILVYVAKSVVLATGGAGQIYERHEVTVTTTGDGYAIAYRAGAEFVDMEMVHFEPYVHAEPDLPLMDRHESEAAFYAPLRNNKGEDFLPNYIRRIGSPNDPFHKQFGIYMPDIRYHVSRAMATEVYEGRGDRGAVFFDLPQVPENKWKADIASRYLRHVLCRGHDVRRQRIHVFPGVIVTLGGVKISKDGESSIPGLYAAGEVAGGVHGAMRLGGNALTDAVVFGARAGASAAKRSLSTPLPKIRKDQVEAAKIRVSRILEQKPTELGEPSTIKGKIKQIMWNNVGILRTEEKLLEAVKLLEETREKYLPRLFASNINQLREALEVQDMLQVSEMVAQAALMRKESRGGHFRLDHPLKNDKKWLKNIIITNRNGGMKLSTRPANLTRYRPEDLPVDSLLAKVLQGIEELKRRKYGEG